jgi:hypothetical protein
MKGGTGIVDAPALRRSWLVLRADIIAARHKKLSLSSVGCLGLVAVPHARCRRYPAAGSNTPSGGRRQGWMARNRSPFETPVIPLCSTTLGAPTRAIAVRGFSSSALRLSAGRRWRQTRPAGRRTGHTPAACASRGRSSRHRSARPSQPGRARPGAGNRDTRLSAVRAPPPRCRAASAGRYSGSSDLAGPMPTGPSDDGYPAGTGSIRLASLLRTLPTRAPTGQQIILSEG